MVERRAVPAAVGVLVFCSGFCALVYQVAWVRELRLVFGASTPASAAVLAVFMGGLGLGGLVLGRRVEASARPLAFYGWLELGAALTAGITPWTVAAVRAAYLAAGGTASLGAFGGTVFRLLLTALVLGVSTFLMGGTLPAVGRAVTAAEDEGRQSLGWVYGSNTLGALLGASLTTFVLLERLGQRKSLWIAALVNLLVATIAISMGRRRPPLENGAPTATALERPAAAPLALVLVAAGLVGFAFFLMELVWYRLLAPLLGGTTYTFGTILLLALAGIGLGGLLYGAAPPRRGATLASFATTCALEGFLLVIPLVLTYRVALLASTLRALNALGFGGLVLGWLVVAGLVVLPASLIAGYQFPLLVALLGAGRRQVAEQTGLVTACNTLGAIVGSIAGGFGLLPLLGAPGAWRFAVLLLALLALVALAFAARAPGTSRGPQLLVPLAAALAAGGLCLLPGPGALWRHGEIGSGRGAIRPGGPNELWDRVLLEESQVVWETDGREGGVALRSTDGYAFSISGKVDGHSRLDAETQVVSPLVGAMLHPAPRQALVIGLGTGSTAGWLAAVPGIERVDVVELEPSVVRVARDCAPVNHAALDNPRLHLTIGDGREYLLTHRDKWDLVVSEPSNPYRAGIASLFTVEFDRAVSDHLAPGGLFVQWVQTYEVDAQTIATIYASLSQAFPYVETWSSSVGDMLLVSSQAPIRHDLARVRRRAAEEPFRSALSDAWGVWGAEGFYSGFVASPAFARRLAAAGAPLNLDDRPVIEFGFGRSFGRGNFSFADVQAQVRVDESRPSGLEGLAWWKLHELWLARALLSNAPILPPEGGDSPDRERALARHYAAQGDIATASERWDAQPMPPLSLIDLLLVSEGYAERGDDRASAVAQQLLADRPVEANALLARWHLRRGRVAEAATHLSRALEGYREDPWPWPGLMKRTIALAPEVARDPATARGLLPGLSQPYSVKLHDRLRQLVRIDVALRAGGGACRDAYRELEPYPVWTEKHLRTRLACYRATGDPLAGGAARDLGRFLDRRPPTLGEQLRGAGVGPRGAGAGSR